MGSSGVGLYTSLPLPSAGTASAGTAPTATAGDHVHPTGLWLPADHGLKAWVDDPDAYTTGSTPTAGTLQLALLRLSVTASITNVCLYVTTAGTSLTSGRNFAALFSAAGALLDTTGDQTTAWASGGLKQMALSGGATSRAAGLYYVGWFWNGSTTNPAFLRAASQNSVNMNLAAPNLRFATADTGLTTAMPSPNFGAQSGTGATAYWAGLS